MEPNKDYLTIVLYVNSVAELCDSLVSDIDKGRLISAKTVKHLLQVQKAARDTDTLLAPIKADAQ